MQPGQKKIAVLCVLALGTVVGIVAEAVGAGNLAAGAKLYQSRCAPCHGPDGKAATPTAQALSPKPHNHTDGVYMNQLSNEHLAKMIKNGGPAVGKSALMPPQTDLNDQQIEDIVAFVRSLAVPPHSGGK